MNFLICVVDSVVIIMVKVDAIIEAALAAINEQEDGNTSAGAGPATLSEATPPRSSAQSTPIRVLPRWEV